VSNFQPFCGRLKSCSNFDHVSDAYRSAPLWWLAPRLRMLGLTYLLFIFQAAGRCNIEKNWTKQFLHLCAACALWCRMLFLILMFRRLWNLLCPMKEKRNLRTRPCRVAATWTRLTRVLMSAGWDTRRYFRRLVSPFCSVAPGKRRALLMRHPFVVSDACALPHPVCVPEIFREVRTPDTVS